MGDRLQSERSPGAGSFQDVLDTQVVHLQRRLASDVVRLFSGSKLTLSVCEGLISGGMLSEKLTHFPQFRFFFAGGVVCASPALMGKWCGLPPSALQTGGNGADELILSLAGGVRQVSGASLGLVVLGTVGDPGPAADAPFSGEVMVGLSAPDKATIRRFSVDGTHERIRFQAVQSGLMVLKQYLMVRNGRPDD